MNFVAGETGFVRRITLLYNLLVCDDDVVGIGLAAAIGGDGFG